MLTPIPFPVRKWKPAPNLVSPQGSPQVFLELPSVSRSRCLILDTCLLGMSGPELQRAPTPRGANSNRFHQCSDR